MSVHIRYMGAKHSLAPIVADVIKELPSGPCLDLFAGMCSVAGALATAGRETWCNDIQKYAALVSKALVASTELPITAEQATSKLLKAFNRNLSFLKRRFVKELEEEKKALDQKAYTAYRSLADSWQHAGNNTEIASEVSLLQSTPTFPYRLATLAYSHGYFGLRQAIALDSLRYAIDFCYRREQLTAMRSRKS
ncbi:MAG: DNA adenine methylase [Blastocatellia bacterium]